MNLSAAIDEDEPVSVVVDRPFVTLIRDLETGAVLFVGRIVELG